jgi:GTP-binding protein EngB required for normal cell division
MNNASDNTGSKLNEHQQRRLLITCKHIDELLSEMEQVLHSSRSESPFPSYIHDIFPGQAQFIEDSIRQFRAQLLRTIAWQQIEPNRPDIPASRAMLTYLTFIDIDAEELKPKYMDGYGKVPEGSVDELNGVSQALRTLSQRLSVYLRQEQAGGLKERLQYLESNGQDTEILNILQQTIEDHGLVEFRPRLDTLIAALEHDHFEVAVFGKVSTGKSSLLNEMLQIDVLPVGVNPITAVPTKLRYGAESMVEVTYASGLREDLPITALADLVTEQKNPNNQRRIARVLVDVPSPRLREGVLFVDTPGLGSLARSGASETLAYLPNSDLAFVLISAGASVDAEDIGTVRLLFEAGIPVLVLLSKADLLQPEERKQALEYIEGQLQRQLGLTLRVHPVSTLPEWQPQVDTLIAAELTPRLENSKEEKRASTHRKIGLLRESMASTITGMIERDHHATSAESPAGYEPASAEKNLRLLEARVQQQYRSIRTASEQLAVSASAILDSVTERSVSQIRTNRTVLSSFLLSEWIHNAVEQSSYAIADDMQRTAKDMLSKLMEVAEQLRSKDHPQAIEVHSLIHGFPRFELSEMPKPIDICEFEYVLGLRFVKSRIRTALKNNIEFLLKQTLENHSRVVQLWAEQQWKSFNVSFETYTSVYTAEIHRVTGVGVTRDIASLELALEELRRGSGNALQPTTNVLAWKNDRYKVSG